MKFINGKPVVRCSSLDQLLNCPGSRTLVAKLGDRDDDESAAWEGIYCHYQSACRFIERGAMAPEGGLPLPDVPANWKPEPFAEWIVEYFFRAMMEDTPADWAIEVEAEMCYEFEKFWLSGHVDVNAVAPDASEVRFKDLKSGVNFIDPAETNWQVAGYAGLFKRAYGAALKRVCGAIVQPRVKEDQGQRVTEVVIEGAQLENLLPFLESKINAALANPMELNTSVKGCRWCAAALQCPAILEELKLMKFSLTKEALDAIKATPDDQLLAQWAIAKKHLGPKIEKAWALAKERLETVGEIVLPDGAKLMLTDWKGPRSLTEEGKPAVWQTICNDLDEKRAYACLDLSIPTLEEQYAAQFNLPIESAKKDSGKRRVEEQFGSAITRKTGKQLTIVL